MAITNFTGSFAECAAKINEKSAGNSWGIIAEAVEGGDSQLFLNVRDSDNNILFRITLNNTTSDLSRNGVRFYYNGGSSNIGYEYGANSNNKTATIYFTSHGFICINNAYSGIVGAWLNINDDGTIIYGGTAITTATSNLYGYLIGCKYDESNYQSLAFTPHTNPSGTTLCSMTAVGSLGEPQIAKYMFYTPVYQSAITGEVEVDGERYVAYGGMWYLKD